MDTSLNSVKEQMGGTYTAELVKRGFVSLAIDYRHYGESGGARQYEHPLVKAENLSASAAYLASRSNVSPERIGCSGYSSRAATCSKPRPATAMWAPSRQSAIVLRKV